MYNVKSAMLIRPEQNQQSGKGVKMNIRKRIAEAKETVRNVKKKELIRRQIMSKPNVISIDGVDYIRKGAEEQSLPKSNAVLVRTKSAGVFYGVLPEGHKIESQIVLYYARRIWYWAGAASLSQLAVEGTSKPKECKFPCTVDKVYLFEVIEVIPMTQKALDSLNSVVVWKH
jgi:hypothetical protein